MSADRQEDEVREAAQGLERGGDKMEQRLDELSEHIDEAKSVAAKRPDAPEQGRAADGTEGDVAGDWQGESSGASQGEDAEDAASGPTSGADQDGEAEPAGEDTGR